VKSTVLLQTQGQNTDELFTGIGQGYLLTGQVTATQQHESSSGYDEKRPMKATANPPSNDPPELRLKGFIEKFDPEIAGQIRSVRKALRKRLPGAVELVYDNYNFFVIAYGPNERASEVILSIAAQAKGVSICFMQGAKLLDPKKLLSGSGNQTRSLRLEKPEVLSRVEVEELIQAALALGKTPMPTTNGYTVIKSVSSKQRPRRAVTKK
jgi:hypothetical protein